MRWLQHVCRFSSTGLSDGVKSIRDMPGPRGLPLLGSTLDYIRYKDKSHKLFFERVKTYGKIYKEKMIAGIPSMVFVCDPSDIETVFRADGKYPDRPEIPLMYEIRDALKMPYAVLLSSNEEWLHQRQPMSQFMMVPRKVGEYHIGFNGVAQDLISAIRKLRSSDKNLVTNLPNLLFKWSFESVAYFTLGKRLGSLNVGNIPKDCLDIIDSTQVFFEAVQKSIFAPPLHKIYPTKLWKTLLSSQDRVYKIAMSFIEGKMQEIETLQEQMKLTGEEEIPDKMDFLTYMLLSGKLSKEEITSNAVDLLFAGIDTTSYTLCWCLYNLATNGDIQERLRVEVKTVVGDNETVTPEHIHEMPLLRNCVKETLRLYPLVPFNTRKLHQDVVLSGYKVPAGIQVIILIGKLKDYFPNEPDAFIPDRWNREGEYPKNPFAFLPFGFGPRMCIGRRVAELELCVSLAQIMKTLCVKYPETIPMDYIMKGVLVPERQLDLVFSDLSK